MILILSINNDYSTKEVINCLISFKKKFLRLNEDDSISILSLTKDDFTFLYKNSVYSLNDFSSVWYRRGGININIDSSKDDYIKGELQVIEEYIYFLLSRKPHINNFFNIDVNKLTVLNYNNLSELNLPSFRITQFKKNASEIDFKKTISKPVSIPFYKKENNDVYMSYTSIVDLDILPEKFVPTFFQEAIDKKFEIRTFFLDNKTYSMAIFSQSNDKTKIDFRNYDEEKPNRVSPFRLPKVIENDLKRILKDLKIDCASVDILYSNDNRYHLIDVNPVGQFGMVSKPCNYNLEVKIANYLSNGKQN